MGGDGGAINTKRSVIQQARDQESGQKGTMTENEASIMAARMKWRYCTASGHLLWAPLVADRKGNLYRKDVVVKELLRRKEGLPLSEGVELPAAAKKLKFFKQLVFESPALARQGGSCRAAAGSDPKTEEDVADLVVCPLTGLPANGTRAFLLHWECGHVVSEEGSLQLRGAAAKIAGEAAEPQDEGRCCWPGCTSEASGSANVVRLAPVSSETPTGKEKKKPSSATASAGSERESTSHPPKPNGEAQHRASKRPRDDEDQ